MKIKTFSNESYNNYMSLEELERKVNDFIKNVEVIDIKYTFNRKDSRPDHSIIVLYKEKESEK